MQESQSKPHLRLPIGHHRLPAGEATAACPRYTAPSPPNRQTKKLLAFRRRTTPAPPLSLPDKQKHSAEPPFTLIHLLPNLGRLRLGRSLCRRLRLLNGGLQDANEVSPDPPTVRTALPPVAPGDVQRGFPLGVFSQRVRASGEQQAGRVRVS